MTLASYSYRRLTDTDEPLVWRMLYEAARVAEEGRLTYETIRFDRYLEKYAKGWARPGDLGIAAFERNREEPVGCAWLRLLTGTGRGDGYLDDQMPELAIGVVPAHRGRGLDRTGNRRALGCDQQDVGETRERGVCQSHLRADIDQFIVG